MRVCTMTLRRCYSLGLFLHFFDKLSYVILTEVEFLVFASVSSLQFHYLLNELLLVWLHERWLWSLRYGHRVLKHQASHTLPLPVDPQITNYLNRAGSSNAGPAPLIDMAGNTVEQVGDFDWQESACQGRQIQHDGSFTVDSI